jgi:hypothetical protein
MTFVNQIGFERNARELGAANVNVVRRFTFEFANSLGVEVAL